jgi:endonuclease III
MSGKLKQKTVKIVRELKKLFPKTKIALNYGNDWELLVAVVLSAQTTDKKVNEVTAKLFRKYRKQNDYTRAKSANFTNDIRQIGLYRGKAKNILATAKIIKKKYGGKIPKTMEELVELPGIGRKTANVILGNAYGIVEGIAVDTHVRRLAKLFGLSKHDDPNKIEKDLMQILPKKEWFLFTYRLIDYGRKYCTARCKHTYCPLKNFIN